MPVHRTAADGYSRVAAAYERGRPGYPAIALEWLRDRLHLDREVALLDLGPGSGQLTRLLVATPARIIAVEPAAAMRKKLHKILGIDVRDGAGDDIPLADDAVDALTVANAFHWFATPEALREMHRVLAPAGALALLWNRRDKEQHIQRALTALVEPYRVDEPNYASMEWRAVVEDSDLFSIVEAATFDNPHQTDVHGVVDRVLSTSFIAALPRAEQEAVLETAHTLAAAEVAPITLRYRTDCYLLRPLAST